MKRLVLVLTILVMADAAYAATITKQMTFSWSFPVELEATITKYEIYNQENQVVIGDIPPASRTATGGITYDTDSAAVFYMRAINDSNPENIEQSGNSNMYVLMPLKKVVERPGNFGRK